MKENEPRDETGAGYADADSPPDVERETIWGINRKDRRLFQALTLTGGNAGSIAVTVLQLKHRSPDDTPDTIVLNIILGIGASFVASGFIAWDLVQIKEVSMAVADWIRDRNARNRERWRAEGREEGRAEGREEGRDEGRVEGRDEGRVEGRAEGRAEGRVEGYYIGYSDAQEGNPQRPPSGNADQSS